MNFRLLLYFESVARNGQFTLSAKELHVSQPALSNSIKKLEEILEIKLFERSTRKLILTESGEIFYNHVIKVLKEYKNVEQVMSDVKKKGLTKLNIGVIESFRYWLPSIIEQFNDKYPDITISIKEMNPTEIKSAIENYEVHVGITADLMRSNELKDIPLYSENLVLMVPENYPIAEFSFMDIKDLQYERLIQSLDGYHIKKKILEACNTFGFTPFTSIETESLETSRGLVEAGLGVSVVPNSFIELNSSFKIKKVYLKNILPKRTVYISYSSERYLPNVVHDFVNITKESITKIEKEK